MVQITKDGIKGVFNGVLSDFGDRMSSDGMSTLGTISFQQFKPTDLKASYDIFLLLPLHLMPSGVPLTHSSGPRVWYLCLLYQLSMLHPNQVPDITKSRALLGNCN